MATKDELLSHLKATQGQWVSGEDLSTQLRVSRAAISKHVRTLRQEGYPIQAVPRKGYFLDEIPDLLLPREIREGLPTRVLGQGDVICLKAAESTNMKAKQLAAGGAPEGTLVVADTQTGGRGRRGRPWFSPPGDGLYASLILRPALSPAEAPRITLLTAVAMAEALMAETGLTVRIKWPNDILINGKKVAGILTEISTEMDLIDHIVVGLGLNVNIPPEGFAPKLRETATSLFMETGRRFSRTRLLRTYLTGYEQLYERFQSEGFGPVIRQWKALSRIIGQRIRIDIPGKTCEGTVTDVDDGGVLILTDDEGRTHRFFSGDFTVVKG